MFWKRFVCNGGLHFTLHTFTRFYEFLGLKVKLVASLNLARVASFPFLGILPMVSAVPGLHLSQPDAATMLLGKKRRFIGEVSTKWVHGIAVVLVGWWLITKVWRARLDIVCVCNLIAAWHDFLGQRYLAYSYVLPHWHASYEHDNDAQNCLLSPKMIISHWKMGLKIFEVNVQIRGYLHTSATLQDFCCFSPKIWLLSPAKAGRRYYRSCWLGGRCWR